MKIKAKPKFCCFCGKEIKFIDVSEKPLNFRNYLLLCSSKKCPVDSKYKTPIELILWNYSASKGEKQNEKNTNRH